MHSLLRMAALAALLAGPRLLAAQTTPAAASASGWQKSIGLSATPTLCYRTLSGGSEEEFIIRYRDDAETSRAGFDAGAALRLTHGTHLRLDLGLGYASRGYRSHTPSPGSIDPGFSPSVKSRYTYRFISLPLQASYAFGGGRLQGFVGGGVALDFLLGVRTEQTVEGRAPESFTETSGYLRGNLTPRLTAGLRYALTPQLNLELAPVVQYSLLASRAPRTPVSEHLYSGGVTVAVYRNI